MAAYGHGLYRIVMAVAHQRAGLNKMMPRMHRICQNNKIGVRPINRLIGAGNHVGGFKLLKRSY